MTSKFLFVRLCLCLLSSLSASASVFEILKEDLNKMRSEKNYEISFPLLMWHNRYTYDKELYDFYNEYPAGIGFGKWMRANNHCHSILFSVFLDSYSRIETYFGYFFRYYVASYFQNGFRFYIGFTIGITQRRNFYYIPVPIIPLPIIGFEMSKFYIDFSYIPGIRNFGNILVVRAGLLL